MVFAPMNSQMCNALQPYCNIPLYVIVDGQTQSDHVLHSHSQSPEEKLLFCFSLHIALMLKHHAHHTSQV